MREVQHSESGKAMSLWGLVDRESPYVTYVCAFVLEDEQSIRTRPRSANPNGQPQGRLQVDAYIPQTASYFMAICFKSAGDLVMKLNAPPPPPPTHREEAAPHVRQAAHGAGIVGSQH